jgi:hypothetical protein
VAVTFVPSALGDAWRRLDVMTEVAESGGVGEGRSPLAKMPVLHTDADDVVETDPGIKAMGRPTSSPPSTGCAASATR